MDMNIDEFFETTMEPAPVKQRVQDIISLATEEASRYIVMADFRTAQPSMYKLLYRKGLLDDIQDRMNQDLMELSRIASGSSYFDLPVLFNMIRHDLMHSEIYSLSDYRIYRRTFFEIARGNGLLLKQIIETFDKKYVDYYMEHLIVKRIDKRFLRSLNVNDERGIRMKRVDTKLDEAFFVATRYNSLKEFRKEENALYQRIYRAGEMEKLKNVFKKKVQPV